MVKFLTIFKKKNSLVYLYITDVPSEKKGIEIKKFLLICMKAIEMIHQFFLEIRLIKESHHFIG